MKDILYFDTAATTPVKKEVIEEITTVMSEIYGNPSSIHKLGQVAKEKVNEARKIIATYFNVSPSEIIFTSGACESNSLAILGAINGNSITNFITTPIEHKSIELICENLITKINVYKCAVNSDGKVNLDNLKQLCLSLKNEKFLVSVQAANSEIGTIQDINEISNIVHSCNGLLHVDATQLIPFQKVNIKKANIDLLSFSGQKIGAPKGIGVLYVKKGLKLQPLIFGSQMDGKRGGTENVPYIAGLAKAIELLNCCVHTNVLNQRDYLIEQLQKEFCNQDFIINGSIKSRLPNNVNISFKKINGESLLVLLDLDGICISTASACASKSHKPSTVLQSIGVNDEYINGTIRITLPEDVTKDEIDYFIERLSIYVKQLSII